MRNPLDLPALDSRLQKILGLLELKKPSATVAAAVDQFVTDYSPSKHWGPCSLFSENCREVWKRGEGFAWAKVHAAFEPDKDRAGKELSQQRRGERDRLISVCEETLRYLLDSPCEVDYHENGKQLKKAVRSYLNVRGHKVGLPAATASTWFHSPDERKEDGFDFGPLTGAAKDLNEWIGGKPDHNYRHLQAKGRHGKLWIVKRDRYTYEVWFRDERESNAAKRRAEAAETPAAKASPRRE